MPPAEFEPTTPVTKRKTYAETEAKYYYREKKINIRWARPVACMEKMRNSYIILISITGE
jgi:hypothetical protein